MKNAPIDKGLDLKIKSMGHAVIQSLVIVFVIFVLRIQFTSLFKIRQSFVPTF
jgi:hypothetical protein